MSPRTHESGPFLGHLEQERAPAKHNLSASPTSGSTSIHNARTCVHLYTHFLIVIIPVPSWRVRRLISFVCFRSHVCLSMLDELYHDLHGWSRHTCEEPKHTLLGGCEEVDGCGCEGEASEGSVAKERRRWDRHAQPDARTDCVVLDAP